MSRTFLLPFLLSMLGICQSAVAPTQSAAPIIVNGSQPAVSPDGSHVAFISNRSGSPDVFIIAADGTAETQLTHSSEDESNLQSIRQLAFVMNDDGSDRHVVSHIPPEVGRAQGPRWSPDGHRLAFQVNTESNVSHIWILDLATDTALKLAAHDQPYLDESPSWFPDGKRLAFQSNRSGLMEIWIMNADGSGQRQITGKQ